MELHCPKQEPLATDGYLNLILNQVKVNKFKISVSQSH